ncbi:MAG: penicillin-binding protein 2 [Rhodospirillales bacterium]|nr:penicillin-binding protein 2 [Rhodospirillales bacterium]
MARDLDRQRQFTRRALLLAGGKAGLLAILAGRLYYLQVVDSERYLTLAEDNRINVRLLPPPRGRILDRTGRPLASNRQDYRVVVVAEQTSSVEGTLAALGTLVPISDGDRKRILREIGRQRQFVPITVREDLDWNDVARIEVNSLDLPGISVEEGRSREYPYGPALSHVLGYVGVVSEADLAEGSDPLLELPGFRIGKAGIERSYERVLRGIGGNSQVEVNAVGRVIRELDRTDGEPGDDVTLGLDLDLQQLAIDRIGDESGAVVVLDVETGEVLAMASTPGYDPSAFDRGLSSEEWKFLTTNPKAPLINKSIAGVYAPGSTFKPVVALAALEKGVLDPSATVFCSGAFRLGDAVFHCWRRGGHGSLAMRDALAQSCDCYFYEAARRVGVDRIAEMGHQLGLGAPLGIDLPHERSGLLPTRDWKTATFGTGWSVGETVITGIGQGYVLSTPLQLAVMSARIANGGKAIVPRMVRDLAVAERAGVVKTAINLGISAAHLKVIQDGMNNVVNSARGTAKSAAIHVPGFEMAGKTGTSQVRRISKGERQSGVIKNEHLPWERRDHALFIGYAPVARPRYSCAVVIEHGGAGSKAAAPIARDVLTAAQTLGDKRVVGADKERTPGPRREG